MKKLVFCLFILCSSFCFSQKIKKYNEYKSIYNSQLQCLGVGTPGSYLLEVGISQKRKKPDYEKAKKSAIFSVLFNGISGNIDYGCDPQKPILNVDSFEKNLKYFEDFFEYGKFAQFVSISNDEFVKLSKIKKGYKLRLKLIINYETLIKKLESDGIRIGLGNYF